MKDGGENKVKEFFSGLSGKKLASNANTAILIAVVVAIAVIFNVILELFPMNIDLTSEKLYTLTDTTKDVLKNLKGEVTIYALYDRLEGEADSTGTTAQVVRVLDLYDKYSNVNVEYIDLDRKPTFLKDTVGETVAKEYGTGDYIVKHGDNFRKVTESELVAVTTQTESYYQEYEIATGLQAETKFTSAILKVFSDVPIVYYSTGFGEASINNFGTVKNYIESSGFDVLPIDLKVEDFDEKAVSIIFFGPTSDLSGEAYNKLERWMFNGGDAFFFMDVTDMDAENSPEIQNSFEYFGRLLDEFGIKLGRSIVKEGSDNTIMSSFYSATTSSAGALAQMPSDTFYYYNSRDIIIDEKKTDATPVALVTTSEKAESTSLDDGRTVSGKKIIAASSERVTGRDTSRIVVFGSGYMATDYILSMFRSSDAVTSIFSYSMKWMELEIAPNVGDDIEAKAYHNMVDTGVIVTEKQIKVIVLIVIVIIPLIILAIGLIIWLRRRHL